MTTFALVEQGESGGVCDCCGNRSRTVWGLISTNDATVACYYVQWTVDGVSGHGANFDLITGKWGNGTSRSDRVATCLEYRLLDNGPAFRVIDAQARHAKFQSLAGQALGRSDVIATPLADQAFAMTDLILARDSRLAELLGNWTVHPA